MQSLSDAREDMKLNPVDDALVAADPRAVFNVRKVIPSYEGPIFLVRYMLRDETERIFDKHGVLQSEDGTPLTLLSKPAVYMVETWYDQSGNELHATQPDKYTQPYLTVKETGEYAVDFRYCRFLNLPDGTVPCGNIPHSVIFKHGEITNPIGGVLGSGNYESHSACNAIRRNGDAYVNYYWSNDLHTERNSYKPGNTVAFIFSSNRKHGSVINGKLNAARTGVSKFSAPSNNTIGKTYGDTEYLNGELQFLYITEEVARANVSIVTGIWNEATGF
jgi:hypothetical protein